MEHSGYPGMGECRNGLIYSGYSKPANPEVEKSGVVTEDDEGWGCYVAPMFGCVHFKKGGGA